MLSNFFRIVAVAALSIACGYSQSPSNAGVKTARGPVGTFEVASVKESPPDHGYTYTSPWGSAGFTARNANLTYLIEIAYGVPWNLIEGQPNWIDSAYYDISAKTGDGATLDYKQVQVPLRRLLEERLHLQTHWVQKEVKGYALVVAKGGPKLQPSSSNDKPYGYILSNGLAIQNEDIGAFASMLVSPVGRPIVDRTGIAGTFKFKLSYATASNSDSNLSDLFTALQEQLGLKLVSQKVPVRMLVIDHVDKIPVEN